MNDVTEVKNSIFDYKKRINKIKEEIVSSEDTMKKIDNELSKTDKWSGNAHDQCMAAQVLICEYTLIIKTLLEELEVCIQELTIDVSGFEAVSRNVRNWEIW
jgi:archaellum component FlaC